MKFYTACAIKGSKILVRGYDNGIRFTDTIQFKPCLFIRTEQTSNYKTLKNLKVKKLSFDSMYDCREFLDKYRDLEDCPIYGNTDFVTQYLMEAYPSEVEYDLSKIKIAYLDLECETENGFPNLDDPNERINLITIRIGQINYVISLHPVILPNCTVFVVDDEVQLISKIFDILRKEDVDIITGWNIRLFDIPYIMGRALKFFTEKDLSSTLPFNMFKVRETKIGQKIYTVYDIPGYNILDYIDLYKKFSGTNQESYALNFIAKVELDEQKLDYSEYSSIKDFYTNNFQKFAEYNVQDTLLVEKLDNKLKLIDLASSIAYEAKITFDTVFFATRIWETICCDYLLKKNIVPPLKTKYSKDEQFIGAYVKDITPGLYKNIVSFDATSLYPSIIMQFNISPDTCIRADLSMSADDFLRSKRKEVPQLLEDAENMQACLACNGSMFSNNVKGFIPILIETTFNQRQEAKKKMIMLQKEYESNKDSSLLSKIAALKIRQSVKKILANSLYGCLGNPAFTYSSPELATAVTVTGQVIIRSAENAMNEYMNKLLKNKDAKDYVIGVDTDSVYLNLEELIVQIADGDSINDVTDLVDKICETTIQRQFDSIMRELSVRLNCKENKIFFKREAIASVGMFIAKKRYALLVDDLEGVRYAEPKLKIMGLEAVKSSTPMIVRNKLKDFIKTILTKNEEALRQDVNLFMEEFKKFDLVDIAFPRRVSDVSAYSDVNTIYTKGTPIATKAALVHNAYVKKLKLDKEVQPIKDTDKIKYVLLKIPNPYGKFGKETVMGFTTSPPVKFELEKYADRELQFEKTVMEPLNNILNAIGWTISSKITLESFFK
jgi:DNA polymerase elongation subunit (family B)